MFPKPRTKQIVNPTLARFVEDRLDELDMSYEEMVEQMGIERILLTRRINNPGGFKRAELMLFVKVLQIKDFWTELLTPFGVGLDGMTARQLETLVKEDGYELGRVNTAA